MFPNGSVALVYFYSVMACVPHVLVPSMLPLPKLWPLHRLMYHHHVQYQSRVRIMYHAQPSLFTASCCGTTVTTPARVGTADNYRRHCVGTLFIHRLNNRGYIHMKSF